MDRTGHQRRARHRPVPIKLPERQIMKTKEIIKRARKLADPFRVTGGKFRIKDADPGETLGLKSEDKPRAKEALAMGVELLTELQDKLYAQDKWAVLLIFQAMDA